MSSGNFYCAKGIQLNKLKTIIVSEFNCHTQKFVIKLIVL